MTRINYVETKEQLDKCIDDLKGRRKIAVDTETNGLDPLANNLLLIQMGTKDVQYIVDVFKLQKYLPQLSAILDNPDIEKIFHNAKFDLKFLKAQANLDVNRVKCTMINDQLLYAGRKVSHSLQNTLNRHLSIPIAKEQQKSFIDMRFGEEFTREQIQYAGVDVEHLIDLNELLEKYLLEQNMITLMELEMDTIYATCDLELNGIYLDPKSWLSLKDEAQAESHKAKIELDSHFVDICEVDMFGNVTLNYNSPSQLRPKLEEITGQAIPSTSVGVLQKINHPVIKALLEYRGHTKRLTTYGEDFLNTHVSKVDGRVHSDFIQLGADSGRYASRNPNMTNIPSSAKYRAAFRVQDSDHKMISADFSGQELRLLAHLSQEPRFIEAIQKGIDLHTNSASLIFGIPYDQVKKPQRNAAKGLTFGLIYGIGPKKLSDNLDIKYEEARQLMDKYYKTFPKIKMLLNDLASDAQRRHVAVSPLDGRQRDLTTFDWKNRREVAHAINISKNLPFQGAGASVTKLALCRIRRRINEQKLDAKLVNVIHDEVVVEASKSCAEEMAKIVEKEMVAAFNKFAPSVPMDVDAQIEDHWVKG